MVGGTDNGRQKTRNHYDVTVGGELFTGLPDHSQTCHAKPKTQTAGAGRYQLLPVGGCPPQAAWPERLSEKSDAVALQQIKERGALPMIDRGDLL